MNWLILPQSDQMKVTVTKLVNEGRLEFINSGWCMNDEAATHSIQFKSG
jgi:lysosomal alpha-mannosidase